MRLARVIASMGQVGTALVAVVGLVTYERVIAWAVVISIVLGLVNFVRLGSQAKDIKDLQESQGQRIDRLPPPPGG